MVPLVDLKANWLPLEKEIKEGWDKVLDKTEFILGPDVAAFEAEYAAFIGVKHCLTVANGTDALELCVRAAGLGPDDEVLVPANSFIATALGVIRAGCKVKFVDCDADHLIDVDSCAAQMSKKTMAIFPVHLFGQVAPMDKIGAFARTHGLIVMEDAAQAQGAKQNGKVAGTIGVSAGTSFYPGKNLGAYGDGGAITTNDDQTAARVRALRNYGSEVKYFHPELGFNSRLDTLQAVVLRAKLKRLDQYNAHRRAAAERYHGLLKDVSDLVLPRAVPGNEHIWHVYAVQVAASRRDAAMKSMKEQGIAVGVHYPVPIHLQGAFAGHGHQAGSFPMAEKAASEMISLPIFPEITAAQQEQVAAALKKAIS